MMTDPIADMLTRIRNAGRAAHRWVDMPTSKLKVQLAQLLKENSFVFDYKVMGEGVEEVLRVYLKYYEGKPVIRHGTGLSTRKASLRRREGDPTGPKRSRNGDPVDFPGCALRPSRPQRGHRR
jgi:small subunit ribosomal protein S8